jgi:hypothetical protein
VVFGGACGESGHAVHGHGRNGSTWPAFLLYAHSWKYRTTHSCNNNIYLQLSQHRTKSSLLTPRSMASLDSLPSELLHDVLYAVHCSSESSNDLFNVLLVAQKYHRAAKDVLYRAPRLLKPKSTDPLSWSEDNAHHLRGLLKTILDRPHLARQIYELDLTVIFELYSYKSVMTPEISQRIDQSNRYHWPDWENYKALVDELHQEEIDPRHLQGLKSLWENHVSAEFEPATASLILALSPSLRHLSLNIFRKYDPASNDNPEWHVPPKNFEPYPLLAKDWFPVGTVWDASAIISLGNVVSIKSNGLVPWSMMSKPNLRSLNMVPARNFYAVQLLLPPARLKVSSNVTSLTMHTDGDVVTRFNPWLTRDQSSAIYLSDLTQCLSGLTSLHLVVSSLLNDNEIDSGFGFALSRINSCGLRTLVFDTRDVVYRIWNYNAQGLPDRPEIHERRIPITLQDSKSALSASTFRPLSSLAKLPDLRRFVGPMEAFVALRPVGDAMLYTLPNSLESIEVVNPTEAFLAGLLEDMAGEGGLPNLKTVLVWQNIDDDDCVQKSIKVSEAVVAWIKRQGIFLGHGLGDMGSERANCYNGAREQIKVTSEQHE